MAVGDGYKSGFPARSFAIFEAVRNVHMQIHIIQLFFNTVKAA